MPVARWPVAVVLVVAGVLLPMFGLSLLVALLVDRVVVRRSVRLSRALDTA